MALAVDNLKEAIIGESNAKIKYELFAEQAQKEDYPEIDHLFRAVSFAESIHIKNHAQAIAKITNSEVNVHEIVKINKDQLKKLVNNTRNNLIQAIAGETFEFKKMYKNYKKNAKKEDMFLAEFSFDLARKAEIVHSKLYIKYLKQLDKKINFLHVDIYVCKICGNVELREAPKTCPNCDHDQKFFIKID